MNNVNEKLNRRKNLISLLSDGLNGIIEWKWSLDKAKNIRKRRLAEVNRQIDIEIARKKGLIH